MSDERTKQLVTLCRDTEMECVAVFQEALKNREWNDLAQGAKDSFSAMVRKEGLIHAEHCLGLGIVRRLGGAEAEIRYVKSEGLPGAEFLSDQPPQDSVCKVCGKATKKGAGYCSKACHDSDQKAKNDGQENAKA